MMMSLFVNVVLFISLTKQKDY